MYHCTHFGKALLKPVAQLVLLCLVMGVGISCVGPPEALADAFGPQRGKASWYGTSAEGKQTANGETFARRAFSAAHKTLPFGTVVRVHNPKNKKQVLVRINDRGPFINGRVIDLSKRAAENIQMLHSGVAPVVFEPVAGPSGRPIREDSSFYVRITDSAPLKDLPALSSSITKNLNIKTRAFLEEAPQKPFALCAGPFATFQEAARAVKKIEKHHKVKDIVEAPTQCYVLPYYAPPKPSRTQAER